MEQQSKCFKIFFSFLCSLGTITAELVTAIGRKGCPSGGGGYLRHWMIIHPAISTHPTATILNLDQM